MATAAPWEFGRLEDDELDALDFTPIPFTVYGYEMPDKEEHAFEFRARPTMPFGASLDVMRKVNDAGDINATEAIRFLYDCLLEEDRDRWDEIVHRSELHFHPDALAQMAQRFVDHYTAQEGDDGRPPLPRSARRAGSRRTGGTSTVKHSGRVSTSAASRSRTRST